MEIFGIQFAPLNVSLERRLQTLAMGAWMATMLGLGITSSFFMIYIILFTKYWWLALLYLLWIWVIDKDVKEQGGRPIKWVQSWRWWKYVRDYFPVRFEKLSGVELDPNRNYLFCNYPHGIICIGAFTSFATEWGGFKRFFPHHIPHGVTMTPHYLMPIFRELALAVGGICASAKSIDYVLGIPGGGHVCVLIVGGTAEAQGFKPGKYKIYLKKRKGFVKLALKNGTPLVPVLSFGETEIFREFGGPWARSFEKMVNKWFGVEPTLFIGRGFFQYSFGILPRRTKVTTVVGFPIEVPKIENPTKEHVEHYHEKFVKELTKMFEEQKYNYVDNAEDKHLLIT